MSVKPVYAIRIAATITATENKLLKTSPQGSRIEIKKEISPNTS